MRGRDSRGKGLFNLLVRLVDALFLGAEGGIGDQGQQEDDSETGAEMGIWMG